MKKFNPRDFYDFPKEDERDLKQGVRLPKNVRRLQQCADKTCNSFFIKTKFIRRSSYYGFRFDYLSAYATLCPPCRAKDRKTNLTIKLVKLQSDIAKNEKTLSKAVSVANKLLKDLLDFYEKETHNK
jgi:hypothetical protein